MGDIELEKEPPKLTAEQMLLVLCEPQFDMRNIVPENADIKKSHKDRWWRSDSPVRGGEPPDVPPKNDTKGSTNGVFCSGKRSGPVCYQSQYQTGSGTAISMRSLGRQGPSQGTVVTSQASMQGTSLAAPSTRQTRMPCHT